MKGLRGGVSGKESVGFLRIHGISSWVGKIPWRRKWQPTPVFLPGWNSMDRGAWWATVHGVAESEMTGHTHTYNNLWFKHLFMYLVAICVFFGEMSTYVFCFFWLGLFLLSCMCYLYILEMKPLSIASFANNFSHSIGCVFILFMVSLAVQKACKLN